jgi:hypothetical protein
MRFKKLTAIVGIAVAGVGAALVPAAQPASAAVGPGEDRQISSPAGWWTYTGVDASYVAGKLSANGARLTDIKVEGGSPLKFTVTMVRNAGAYGSAWWWYYGQTASQVVSTGSANNARPIAIHGYNTSSGIRFATVYVSNTGANAEPWSFYYGTPSYIGSKVNPASNRMVSLGRIQGTSYYTALFGSNTGTDATGWWWYYGKSTAQLQSLATTNGARLVDLDRNNDSGTFNAIMYKGGPRWRFYNGYSISGLLAKAGQDGQRLFDVTPYYSGGSKYFAAVGVNNLDALSTKLDGLVASKLDSGSHGFYLKQVGGGQLAGLLATKQFEPASSLKVLYHLKAIDAEEAGTTNDSTSITYHYNNLSDPADKDICPDNFSSTATTNQKDADTRMMWNSDNRMTRGILEKYGKASMLTLASQIGMKATAINHNIGCGSPSNYTTLYDLGRVYESFQNGSVVSNSTWRANFRARMLNQTWSGFKNSICPVVQQEAAKLGKSSTVATNFCNTMTWVAKGGSYSNSKTVPMTVQWSGSNLTGVPFKSGGVVTPRYFNFGYFVNNLQLNTDAEKTSVQTALGTLYPEAIRPQIRAALLSGW